MVFSLTPKQVAACCKLKGSSPSHETQLGQKHQVHFPPMEAMMVAIHPYYRGEQLDGKYYDWLLDLYDNDMPDIVRRVNKFRGFPQNDDPVWNPVNSEEWHVRYDTEEYRAEIQRYMPYLEAYWNRDTNSSADFHAANKHQADIESIEDYDSDILEDDEFDHVTGEVPPTFNRCTGTHSHLVKDHWLKEIKESWHHFSNSLENRAFSALNSQHSAVPNEQHGISNLVATDGHFSLTTSCGLFVSPHYDRNDARSPGLLWYHQNTYNNDDMCSHNLLSSIEPQNLYPGRKPQLQGSVSLYHSPAGDLVPLSPKSVPGSPKYDDIRARLDVQALARANGFMPSPRNGIGPLPGCVYAEQDSDFFPMGAFRYDPQAVHLHAVERSGQSGITNILHGLSKHQKNTGVCGKPPTSSPANKRKREQEDDDNNDYSPSPIPRTPKAKRSQRGDRRRRRKGKKNKKSDLDEDYQFTGLELDDEDKKYEALPSKLRTSTTGHRRRSQKKIAPVQPAQPELAPKQEITTESGNHGEPETYCSYPQTP
jgi:hypothetical protein